MDEYNSPKQFYNTCIFFHRGLYITINDIGHVYEIMCNWPEVHVQVCIIV